MKIPSALSVMLGRPARWMLEIKLTWTAKPKGDPLLGFRAELPQPVYVNDAHDLIKLGTKAEFGVLLFTLSFCLVVEP